MGEYRFFCLVQRGYGLSAGDRGKVVQEIGEWVTCLEVVHQSLKQNPRSEKDGSPVENIRVTVNQAPTWFGTLVHG
jgi:hypothetical protein